MVKPIDRTAVRPEAADTTSMMVMAQRFERLRQRSRRRWRRYQSLDDPGDLKAAARAHTAWSTGIDETLSVVDAISRIPSRDVGELAIKLDAILWWIDEDGSILDAAARRWLARFRRSLRRLATGN
jgi:hypothetical protein